MAAMSKIKCPNCGREQETFVGEYQYLESGLDNVIIDGIEILRCPCGEHSALIPHIVGLHKTIAKGIIEQMRPLNEKEIRFLRKNIKRWVKEIGMSDAEFTVLTNPYLGDRYYNYATCRRCRKLATVVKLDNEFYCKNCLTKAIAAIDRAILESKRHEISDDCPKETQKMDQWLTTTFSPMMLSQGTNAWISELQEIPSRERLMLFTSAVGHENTAKILSLKLGVAVNVNRINLTLKPGDLVLAAIPQFRAEQAREFSEEEIEQAEFRYFLIRVC